ncbi:hypothetical protein K9N68_33200 [Kovacikia minuta CCNUW1]|uniref:hypothetical protein n=1 Tax=Kovacikia minuta TaxID=2931930 RepID=UPI001CCA8958|nr:hypothetical protein [Kovacikia minuta]UBF26304.1 hypothetical protein K9N68_33200 [Kovacikia minuta CCNUW1]
MNRPLRGVATLTSTAIFLGSQASFLFRPAQAQIFEGFTGCPAGTREGPANFVANGNFTASPGVINAPLPPGNPAGFTSTLPYRSDRVYPSDSPPPPTPLGGLSIQTGAINYFNGIVIGQPFPGDAANGVGASNTYLYSNPNASATTPRIANSAFPNPIIWRQVISGLTPNTTYNFTAYFYNLLAPSAAGNPPVIRCLAGPPGGANNSFVPALPGRPVTVRQQWTRVQGLFRTSPGQTALELRIEDSANTIFGDDFGMTAIGFRECIPLLQITKRAETPLSNPNGTFTIPYTVEVRNTAPAGNSQFDLINFRLTDNLAQAFAGATINSVTNIQSQSLTVNPSFNGSSDQNLLQGTDTLLAGTTATVSFSVTITPGSGANSRGPFNNTSVANASSRGGTPVNGSSPSVQVVLTGGGGGGGDSTLRLVKRVTNVIRSGTSLNTINFGTFVDDPGTDDNAPGWAQLPQGAPVGVFTIGTNTPLQSGDQVEYTIYYLAEGGGTAIAVNLCDAIPPGTEFIANSIQVQRGSSAPTPSGNFFPPLAPLPSNNPCENQTNLNGSILFDVGDVPTTPGGNIGFARFRVRVE